MEASQVRLLPETRAFMTRPLTRKHERTLHKQRALEYLKNKPYGQRTTGAEVARVAGYKFDQSGITVLRSLEKHGLITKHEIKKNEYFYTTDESAKTVKAPMPTPLVLIDTNNAFHSDSKPAIRWKGGKQFYYLHGTNFEKKDWQKIVALEMTLEDIAKGNLSADQNARAIQFLRPDRLLEQIKAKLIHTGIKGTELYEVKNFMDTGRTEYCMKMEHPSIEGKLYIEWVESKVGVKKDADLAQATAFGISKQQYLESIVA